MWSGGQLEGGTFHTDTDESVSIVLASVFSMHSVFVEEEKCCRTKLVHLVYSWSLLRETKTAHA